jgi:hypothetical protein
VRVRGGLLALLALVLALLLSPSLAGAHTPPADGNVVAASVDKPDKKQDKDDGDKKQDKGDDDSSAGKEEPKAPPPVRLSPALAKAAFASYRVFATQYAPLQPGSVEVAVPDKCLKFAALRNSAVLASFKCGPGYGLDRDYRMVVTRESGESAVLPVKEAGPWNVDDNWWQSGPPPNGRRMFNDLATGTPQARAAFEDGHNKVDDCKDLEGEPTGKAGGADQFGRCVLNAAGIDLSLAAARQLGLGAGQNAWVTVSLLWQPVNVKIANQNSKLNLDLAAGSQAAGAAAVQSPASGAPSQRWRVRVGPGGDAGIVSVHSGKSLGLAANPAPEGTAVVQAPDTGSPAQRWRVAAADGGTVTFASQATGQLLDVRDGSTAAGAPVIQWPANGGLVQRWTVAPAP